MSEEKEIDHSSQYSLDYARKEGLRIVVPSALELQIDIDSASDLIAFETRYSFARQLGLVSGYSTRASKSGGDRYHVTVNVLHRVTPLERIALQAILGSDWRREILSLDRLNKGDAIPTLFFEKTEGQQAEPESAYSPKYPSQNLQL